MYKGMEMKKNKVLKAEKRWKKKRESEEKKERVNSGSFKHLADHV